MDLFTVGKIPMYCEGITHRLETRKHGEVKVIDLSLKIAPFNAQLAAALDPDEYGFVKRVLFKMNDGEPVVDLRAVEFRPPSDRQRVICYIAPDTDEGSICLDQVKVTKMRARSSKDANGWTLYVQISFGPVSPSELAFANEFYTGQRWLSWEAAEPSLAFGDDDDTDETQSSRPAPMFDDNDPNSMPVEGAEARTVPKRRPGRPRKKVDHDGERAEQTAEGQKAIAH
jgi:hypothetical protein